MKAHRRDAEAAEEFVLSICRSDACKAACFWFAVLLTANQKASALRLCALSAAGGENEFRFLPGPQGYL